LNAQKKERSKYKRILQLAIMNGLEENSEDIQPSTGPMGSIQDKYTTFANDKD
jgi:hypothetical protein